MFTRSTTIRILRSLAITIAAVLIVTYAVSRSLNYVRGPVIEVITPTDGSATSSTMIEMVGQAMRVNSLSLNGLALSIDEHGNFHKPIVVFSGLNILTLEAHDQFGRQAIKQLRIVGTF